MEANNEIVSNTQSYFSRIYFTDWPIGNLNNWCNTLVEDGKIRPEICEALIPDYLINDNFDIERFQQFLYRRMTCDGKICTGTCDRACATAGNFSSLLNENQLNIYDNLHHNEKRVLDHYWFKVSDAISKDYTKYRIGALIIHDDSSLDDFIKQEVNLILYQLRNQFYFSDHRSLNSKKKTFRHIKYYTDTVVIIVTSSYSQLTIDEYLRTVLNRFSYLKIFLVKTADTVNEDNDQIRAYYRKLFPRNRLFINDWLKNPKDFPCEIRKHLSILSRLKIAIYSQLKL